MNLKKFVMMISMGVMFSCLSGVAIGVKGSAEELPCNFNGTQIVGTQLRLDDAGMRFVMEMNEADYAKFNEIKGTDDISNAGVLILPTELIPAGEKIDINTPEVLKIEFNDAYNAKKIQNKQVLSYQFNAVLQKIPDYVVDVTAVGFVYDGTNYHYTAPKNNTVSRIASDYYGTFEEGSIEQINTDKYLLKGYNDYQKNIGDTTSDKNNLEEVKEAITNSVTIDKSTIIAGDQNSNITITKGLDKVFDIKPATNTDDTILTVKNNIVNGLKFGSANVNVTFGNNFFTSENKIDVLDTTLVEQGAGWRKSGKYTPYKDGVTYMTEQAVLSAKHQFNSFIDSNGKPIELIDGYDGYSDSKVIKYEIRPTYDMYLGFKPRYTKEQIKMLIDAGYDTIEMPLRLDVNVENTPSLDGRNYVSVYTPNNLITGQTARMGFDGGVKYQACNDCGRFYFNTWNTVKMPLQVLHDNYVQLTDFKVSNLAGSYDEMRWAWFGLSNEKNGGSFDSWDKTLYIGDFKLTRSEDNVFSSSEICSAYNGIISVPCNDENNSRLAGKVYGEINGRKSKDMYYITNVRYGKGVNTGSAMKPLILSESGQERVYIDLLMSKEELIALKNSGKTCIEFDVCYEIIKDFRTDQSKEPTIELKYNMKDAVNGKNKINVTKQWQTLKLDLQNLIDRYDEYTCPRDGSNGIRRNVFFITCKDSISTVDSVNYTVFMDNFIVK